MKPSILRIATRRRGPTPRRVLVHALLLIALLVAQLGAFTHALSHAQGGLTAAAGETSGGAHPAHTPGTTHQADAACALCSAFAATAAALVDRMASVAATGGACAPNASDQLGFAASTSFSFLSRAPPFPAVV